MAEKLELVLVAFALPPLFPPEAVPDAGARFVAACHVGMTKRQLLSKARAAGWRPSWDTLPNLERDGVEAYGFALSIEGTTVPLIARMRRTQAHAKVSRKVERDPRQLSLF